MPRTLFVARLWFEGNRFSARPTTMADFEQREWRRGAPALAAAAGTATELGALASFAASAAGRGWQLRIGRCAAANPGGPIEEAVFQAWLDELQRDLAAGPVDAVYLSLHGAAITTSRDSPELDALQAVRAQIGPEVPLGASFDLHANLPPAIVEPLDFASGYRTYPHVDMDATAARVLQHLAARAEGRCARAHGALASAGVMLPSFRMRHDIDPMRSLLAQARAVEHPAAPAPAAANALPPEAVLDATLFGGFPYADTAHTGASAMVWAGSAAAAQRHAAALARALREREADFAPRLRAPRDALLEAATHTQAIVAVTDPADNPLSGGALDTPGLLRALLELRREPGSPLAAFAPGRIVFAALADATLVARAAAAGIGASLSVRLGAQASADYGAAIELEARVAALNDGRFANVGPMERGCEVDAGPCAVLEAHGILIVITSAVVAANDPAFFRLQGVALQAPLLLAVKAKNHFRAAFEPLCAAIVDADCPGPAAADLDSLPFRRARRQAPPRQQPQPQPPTASPSPP